MLRLFWHYVLAQAGRFMKLEQISVPVIHIFLVVGTVVGFYLFDHNPFNAGLDFRRQNLTSIDVGSEV